MLGALAALHLGGAPAGASTAQRISPQRVLGDLLANDRKFAAMQAPPASALVRMFDDDVLLIVPNAALVRGKANAKAALERNPANLTGSLSWSTVWSGVSADGTHAFTAGYMTATEPAGPAREMKYLAYWIKRGQDWRMAALKRAPRPPGPLTNELTSILPATVFNAEPDVGAASNHRESLEAAELAFSRAAGEVGLGRAFEMNGRADSLHLGRESTFIIGAANIAAAVAAGSPPLEWTPDGTLVASSGDLGLTWGMIRLRGGSTGSNKGIPFFTIWIRSGPGQPWRYIAE